MINFPAAASLWLQPFLAGSLGSVFSQGTAQWLSSYCAELYFFWNWLELSEDIEGRSSHLGSRVDANNIVVIFQSLATSMMLCPINL